MFWFRKIFQNIQNSSHCFERSDYHGTMMILCPEVMQEYYKLQNVFMQNFVNFEEGILWREQLLKLVKYYG